MCDQDHFEKDRQEYEALGLVTRRQFGVMLGAGMAMMLPQVANAVTVTESDVSVMTPDGTADGYFVHPASGTAPGVLVWPDIFGLRPAFRQMGKRLAESGYSVLVVNPFHGGGLVTDMPNSPHLQVAKTKAQLLIAIAANDDMRSPEEKNVLKETFTKAKLPAEIEVYAGAAHGWCPPDSQVYNEPQAEKAWSRLLALYGKALAGTSLWLSSSLDCSSSRRRRP